MYLRFASSCFFKDSRADVAVRVRNAVTVGVKQTPVLVLVIVTANVDNNVASVHVISAITQSSPLIIQIISK